MAKITKIGFIREELGRIASCEDRMDQFAPTMMASWSYTRVMIIGKLKMQSFDLDILQETLGKIPSGAGEAHFWRTVELPKLEEPVTMQRQEYVVLQFADRKAIHRVQA